MPDKKTTIPKTEEKKSEAQLLSERLFYKIPNVWESITEADREKVFKFNDEYKKILDLGKTEREFAFEAVKFAKENGFVNIDELIKKNTKLKPGMKVFKLNREKAVCLATIGKKATVEGVNLIGAHIDSPRIDVKQNPLYEDGGLALFKTHYYGGIKKYQWVAIPLALHGVIIKKDGQKVNINIGEEENDPIFAINDLLPHLGQDQMQKKATEVILGEDLNLLIGSEPFVDKDIKEKVKFNILKLLNEKYGIVEQDFTTAELEIVPAFKARDIGFDRSMIGAYGQDDRVCAFPALKAICDVGILDKTAICVLTDKEEIGSVGNTGAQSKFLEDFVAEICYLTTPNYSDIILRRCFNSSKMLSADVNAGFDPSFPGVHEKKNVAFLGNGLVISKFTGSRGKSGASDAHAEYLAELRKIFDDNNIHWQTAELGKVDQGGGGTIAMMVANLGVDVVDCGVAVLSMHAPLEVTSKVDVYETYKAYMAFMKDMK